MSDVLSQNEIDALLSALSSGEIEPEQIAEEENQKVKAYDFRSPQKFSKDHIRTLEVVHENFARVTSNYLTAQLRKNVKLRIKNIEQITFDEFVHSMQNPTMMTNFKLPPLSGTLLFECNSQFSFAVIDILLGGSGERIRVNKEYTDIDKKIILKTTKGILANLKLAWEDVLDVDVEVDTLETNPVMNQTVSPNEPVAIITFSIELGNMETYINMCIPYMSIEKISDKIAIRYWADYDEEDVDNDYSVKIKSNIEKVDVNIAGELGETQITVDEFLKLRMGDVVVLDNKCTNPIKVYVEDEESFYARPGTIGKNRGVSILDIIDKDVDKYE